MLLCPPELPCHSCASVHTQPPLGFICAAGALANTPRCCEIYTGVFRSHNPLRRVAHTTALLKQECTSGTISVRPHLAHSCGAVRRAGAHTMVTLVLLCVAMSFGMGGGVAWAAAAARELAAGASTLLLVVALLAAAAAAALRAEAAACKKHNIKARPLLCRWCFFLAACILWLSRKCLAWCWACAGCWVLLRWAIAGRSPRPRPPAISCNVLFRPWGVFTW